MPRERRLLLDEAIYHIVQRGQDIYIRADIRASTSIRTIISLSVDVI